MEIKVSENQIETSGIKESFTMGVSTDGGFITHFLRDTLYSNKIGAVCREIGSNAYDANVESGRGQVPIVIAIENKDTLIGGKGLTISFKDSGPGMNIERMKIYSQYAASTKRKTNTQIGGFGLGAKTPFAYHNNYMIETVAEDEYGNKTKYTYQAILGGDGQSEESKILLIMNESSTEETGTKIIIPIQEYDREKFEFECYYMSHLWDVQPLFLNFKTVSPAKEVIYTGEGFKVYKKNTILRDNHMCSVAGIIYPIDIYSVRGFKKVDGNYSIVFEFNTGEIALNGGRELLKYTDDTKLKIEQRFSEFKVQLTKEVHDYYNAATSYVEAMLRAIRLNLYNIPDESENKNEFVYFLSQFNRHILNFKPDQYGNKKVYYTQIFNQLRIELISPSSIPESFNKKEIKSFGPELLLLTLPIYEIKPGKRKNVKKILGILSMHPKALIVYHPKKLKSEESYSNKNDYESEIKFFQDLELTLNDFELVKPLNINLNNSSEKKNEIEIPFRRIVATNNSEYYDAKYNWEVKFNKEEGKFISSVDGDRINNAKHIVIIPVDNYNSSASDKFYVLKTKLSFVNEFMNTAGFVRDKPEILTLFVNHKKIKYFSHLTNLIDLDDMVKIIFESPEVQKQIEDVLNYKQLEDNKIENDMLDSFKHVIPDLTETVNEIKKSFINVQLIPYSKRNLAVSIMEEQKSENNKIVLNEQIGLNSNKLSEVLKKYPIIRLIHEQYNDLIKEQMISGTKLLIQEDLKREELKKYVDSCNENKD